MTATSEPARHSGIKPFLAKVAGGAVLAEPEAEAAFEIIMSGDATPTQIGAFLMALRVRGETIEEISGAVRVMRAKALKVQAPVGAIDIVGTGGDASGTHNISTAAALIVASCGVPVAKHGNRALSSKSGSADVLTALGVNIEADLGSVERSIRDAGIGFMMAPRHHSAMRHVAGPRVELGTRTIFNLLGPLANPAGVLRQFSGTFAEAWIVPMAEVLGRLGSEKAWVVHGSDGLDELTTTGASSVAALEGGTVTCLQVHPSDAGLPTARPEDLKGGDGAANAVALRAMLGGERGPFRDVALFNAAAGLVVADTVATLRDGVERAAEAVDTGAALAVLDRLVEITAASPPASASREARS